MFLTRAGRMTPEVRTSAFYATFFTNNGAAVMFLPIWLSGQGITTEQIGIINAVPIVAILLLNLLVGRLADKASDWRQVIVIGSLIGGIVPIGLLFVNEFWGILLFWTLATLPGGAVAPVLEAAAMRLARRNGTQFGVMRAWGTMGYMLFNALTGYLVVWFGAAVFVPLYVGLALLRAAVALQLPAFRAPPEQITLASVSPVPARSRLRDIAKPWFLLPLLGFCLVFATHVVVNSFGSLLWKEQGLSEQFIGPLIALGSLSEVFVMFLWTRFGGKVSARVLMLIAAGAAVFRWAAMGFAPGLEVLILLQFTHGLTFAIGYLGCVHFIANWAGEDIAAEAQSLYVVGQQVCTVLALLVFGRIVQDAGAHAYFIAAGLSVVGGVLIWVSLKMKPAKSG